MLLAICRRLLTLTGSDSDQVSASVERPRLGMLHLCPTRDPIGSIVRLNYSCRVLTLGPGTRLNLSWKATCRKTKKSLPLSSMQSRDSLVRISQVSFGKHDPTSRTDVQANPAGMTGCRR
jgi:hypothetical protein